MKINPNWLMACMAFETGETFSPSIESRSGSHARGLIQFMIPTAIALGTTSDALGKMSFVQQMSYVEKYFKPYAGNIKSLEDTYMAILFPRAIGKTNDYVLFDKNDTKYPQRYIQNRGLDANKDGKIIKDEVCEKIRAMLSKGLQPDFFG